VCTNYEFSKAFGKAMWRPWLFPAPEFALNLVFGEERAKVMTKGQHVKPKRVLEYGFQYHYPDIKSACSQLAETVQIDQIMG
jgi:uncharacterized protein